MNGQDNAPYKFRRQHINNGIAENEESEIRDFYGEGNVLITGSTGFLGKVLTEKLLRICRNLSNIYCLIRPKGERTVETRMEDFLGSSVFDRIKAEEDGEKLLSKIICVPGDITQPNLGVSEEHLQTLLGEVTVVFHVAATVKFTEPLETAIKLNTIGTYRVVLFCRQMSQLKALIHVSTAYSNSDKKEIRETVYPLPEDISLNKYSNDELPAEFLKKIGEKMVKNHPNTYTTTKAMAEWIVNKYAGHVPTAIVRPSIVTAAWKEPGEGWLDNMSGISGIMTGIGQGLIRTIYCDDRLVVDIIPVDIVVNTLIVSAWYTSTCRSNAVQVYNCTSGPLNPITWEKLGICTTRHVLDLPSIHVNWYPGFTFRTNRFMHIVHQIMFNFVPALLADITLKLTGSKPIMLKIVSRLRSMGDTGEFFALHQFNFASENFLHLHEAVKCPYDREVFNIDIRGMDWDSYVRSYVLGIRTHVLKDSVETIPIAKKKLQKLYWTHKALQTAVISFYLIGIKYLLEMIL